MFIIEISVSSSQVDSCDSVKEGVVDVKEAECNSDTESRVSRGAMQRPDSSPDSSVQNGSDKADQEEPRRKRGRRKLERPEKR